ncbi:MAG: MMPL family transporter [Lachnospiraceae bacterium]|nr:MMPL family transporter [Lachnospiraceae bacterium]
MIKFGKKVVKLRVPILIISVLLLIPSVLGIVNTRINYDILSYLPGDIETMEGQDILMEEFNTGAFSICVVEGMENKDVSKLREQMEEVPHVKTVIWYDSVADLSVPMEILPEDVRGKFVKGEDTMIAVMYDSSMSSDETMEAVKKIRSLAGQQCFVSGMSAVVTDIKDICNQEMTAYVAIAGALSCVILALTMDSFLAPVFFLISIGMAILYNLGSNVLSGEICYITQALAAVLQLGVTMDYSIFLWHSYEENQERFPGDKKRAMSHAISNTLGSVLSSSTTTVAGFVALCFMTFTLGMDLGIVMAKGVLLGVVSCVTVLPSMLLVFDRPVSKTKHRPMIPDLGRIAPFVVRHYKAFAVLFLLVLGPAVYGYTHTGVYYDLAGTLPKDLPSIQANEKLNENFQMNTTHILLLDSQLSQKEAGMMKNEMEAVDGVSSILGIESLVGPAVPLDMIPEEVKEKLMTDNYQMMMISSEYKIASDEVNRQITELNAVLKKYDSQGMLIGEAPCTKDLINITDKDFKVVSVVSILAVFVIILLTFKSISIPIILVSVIEFAIFINMGIPAYTGTVLPFIASVVIGTIQLGATVDYAILMTTRYRKERSNGADKAGAITIALSTSVSSVVGSALSFFAATVGVAFYSRIDMIGALCTLMSRGAIISMFVAVFILPAMFMVFDGLICATSRNFGPQKQKKVKTEQIKTVS